MVVLEAQDLAVPPETIGERMKRARRFRGVEIGEMADEFDVSVETIRSWEQSRNQPRNFMDVVQHWAHALRVPLPWLLAGNDPDQLLMKVIHSRSILKATG